MNLEELSKEVSYALRHAPWVYELELDEEGWTSIEHLVNALRENSKWAELKKEDILKMISTSSKKRHETRGDKIRAFYGHSVPQKIFKIEEEPPCVLYHGTTHEAVQRIRKKGLLPRERQYVHLSENQEIAMDVGQRRDAKPIILVIDAKAAYENGVKFYHGNEKVWLSAPIPPQYLSIQEEDKTKQLQDDEPGTCRQKRSGSI